MASPIRATLPKAEREVSMTMKVRELLSWAVLDTSGHVSENSTPRRLNPMVVLTPLPHKLGYPSRPVDTSSQVCPPRWCWDGTSLPGGNPCCPLSHSQDTRAQQQHPSHRCRPSLWEEANKALWGLLATKPSINAHQQKLVWELGMGLFQNNSETTESIKKAKAICAHSTQEAKILCSTTIKEVKATCTHSIQEAEILCSMAIRDMQRPRELPRLTHFTDHILSPSSTWKNKLLRRRVRVSLTTSPPVKLTIWARPCGTSAVHWYLPITYWWDRHQYPTNLTFHKELLPLSKCLHPHVSFLSCAWALT